MSNTLRNPSPVPEGPRPESVAERIDGMVARGEMVLTELGKQLLEARRRIEQSGIPMLNREELDREKAERRGGVESRDSQ